MVNRYPNGKQVTVYYNPDNPADAFLEAADVSLFYLGIGIGIVLAVVGLLLKPGLARSTGNTGVA